MTTPAGSSKVTQGFGSGQTCAYCHGFAKIPPLIRSRNGKMYMNPDFEQVGMFTVRAEPFDFSLPAGQAEDFAMTVPAEEADLGDLLINELHGAIASRDVAIEMLSTQTTRTFQNAPIWNTLLLGNAQLNCCLPCCTLVQATASLSFRVTNNDSVPVNIRITGRGKRFLSRNEELRARMLMYWNSIPSFPFFLTFDNQEVLVPAGQTVTGLMTVPGTGDFEVKGARCEVLPAVIDPDVILVSLTEQVGRELQSDPLPLGSFVATPTLVVAGFPGGLYRAASACSCPPISQLLKRNTKLRVTMTNTGGADATVRLVFPGCFHEVSECPPGRSMDRIRSLEPTIGPLLVSQRDYCPPAEPAQAVAPAYQEQPAYQPPAPVQAQPQPVYQAPAAPARRTMFVPGYGTVVEGTGSPLEYVFQQYEAGPGGSATAKPEYARAHGLAPGAAWSPPALNPIGGLGGQAQLRAAQAQAQRAAQLRASQQRAIQQRDSQAQHVVQRGQQYWDPIMREWRRA